MIGRLALLMGVWTIVLVAAVAQTSTVPPPAAIPSPTPSPEARPVEVMTPREQADLEATDQSVRPLRPGVETEHGGGAWHRAH